MIKIYCEEKLNKVLQQNNIDSYGPSYSGESAGLDLYNCGSDVIIKSIHNNDIFVSTINKKNGVAKNYFNSVFSIPTITYEVGDNTNREAIKSAARKFANSMMIILLNDDSTT